MAIAVFFALGTAAGGVAAPWLFGVLIGTGSRESVFLGYALGGRTYAGGRPALRHGSASMRSGGRSNTSRCRYPPRTSDLSGGGVE